MYFAEVPDRASEAWKKRRSPPRCRLIVNQTFGNSVDEIYGTKKLTD
jgi:hypothetical protein